MTVSACANCGAALAGPFCHQCGQAADALTRSAAAFWGRQISDAAGIRSRSLRTLAAILMRPGDATHDYLSGRVAPYRSPLGFYLFTAAAFFVLQTFNPFVRFVPVGSRTEAAFAAISLTNALSAAQVQALRAAAVPLDVFGARLEAATAVLLPALLLASLVLFGGVAFAFFRKAPDGALRHSLFALHAGAFYMTLAGIDRILSWVGWSGTRVAITYSLVTVVYLSIALRRVYGGAWVRLVGVAFVMLVLLYLLLAGWVEGVVGVAVRVALR